MRLPRKRPSEFRIALISPGHFLNWFTAKTTLLKYPQTRYNMAFTAKTTLIPRKRPFEYRENDLYPFPPTPTAHRPTIPFFFNEPPYIPTGRPMPLPPPAAGSSLFRHVALWVVINPRSDTQHYVMVTWEIAFAFSGPKRAHFDNDRRPRLRIYGSLMVRSDRPMPAF